MSNELLYKKQWRLLQRRGIDIKNSAPLKLYIDKKVQILEKTHLKPEQKNEKNKILSDFFEMYEFDKKSNEIPIPFGYFSSKKEMDEFQKRDLLSKELILCVGNIYSNYHERIIKNSMKIHCIDIPMLSIDYNRLYMRAVNEYVGSYMNIDYPNILNFKNSNKNSTDQQYDYEYVLREYRGAIVPLPTIVTEKSNIPICQNSSFGTVYFLNALIERFLTIQVQSKFVHKYIDKIIEGKFKLNSHEQEIINYFEPRENKIIFASEFDCMKELYDIFVKYKTMERNPKHEMLLAGRNIYGKGNYVRTLGSIIRTEYVKEITCPEQYKLIRTLFDTDKMNLRNRIMHGTDSLFNYFSINISAILMQLLWDIMDESIFIDSNCSNGCNSEKSKLR